MSKKTTAPVFEDEINSKLSGDMQKNALDFVAYMRAAGMTSNTEHSNAFMYRDEWVCIVCIYPDDNGIGWTIFDNPLCGRKHADFPVDEDLKEFARAHVNICGHFASEGKVCGCGSQPGSRKTIFGKEYDNVCTSEVAFRNPNGEVLEKIKQLIEAWRLCVDSEGE